MPELRQSVSFLVIGGLLTDWQFAVFVAVTCWSLAKNCTDGAPTLKLKNRTAEVVGTGAVMSFSAFSPHAASATTLSRTASGLWIRIVSFRG
jgi:hypothetical protein